MRTHSVDTAARNNDNIVATELPLMETETFTQLPSDPVAIEGPSYVALG